jgi:integrase/recombinase XerD
MRSACPATVFSAGCARPVNDKYGRSGLMERGDWPNCVDTIRRIYEPEAFQATFIVATEDEADLLKFLLGSGYRDQENRYIGVFGS